MLYALEDPRSFVLLLVAFVLWITLMGWLSALAAARAGWPGVRQERRTAPDPRRQVDPFGAVSGAISGLGWSRPLEPGGRRGVAVARVVLLGPLVVLALGLGLLAVHGVAYGPLGGASSVFVQRGLPVGDLAQRALLLAGLSATYSGALCLVPLPPLPGGQVLFALAPRSAGWQKAELQLVERNIGTAVLLALLLIPLGSPQALLPTVLDSLLSPLVRLVGG